MERYDPNRPHVTINLDHQMDATLRIGYHPGPESWWLTCCLETGARTYRYRPTITSPAEDVAELPEAVRGVIAGVVERVWRALEDPTDG